VIANYLLDLFERHMWLPPGEHLPLQVSDSLWQWFKEQGGNPRPVSLGASFLQAPSLAVVDKLFQNLIQWLYDRQKIFPVREDDNWWLPHQQFYEAVYRSCGLCADLAVITDAALLQETCRAGATGWLLPGTMLRDKHDNDSMAK
jgi:hypothetical protein